MTVEPGAWKALPRGWSAQPAVQSFATTLAEKLYETFHKEMQDIMLPLAATGHLPEGGTDFAGVTLQGIIDQAATWVAPDVTSYANCIADACSLVLDLCAFHSPDETLLVSHSRGTGRTLKVGYTGLKGDDLQGFRVDISIDTENKADKMRDKQLAMQMAGAQPGNKLMSMRSIRTELGGIDDPDQEEYLLDMEEVWNSEQMKAYRLALAAEHLGMPRPQEAAPVATPSNLPQGPAPSAPPQMGQGAPQQMPPGLPQGMPQRPQQGVPQMMPGQRMMQPGGAPVMPGQAPMPRGPMQPGQARMMPQQAMPNPGLVPPQGMGGNARPMPVPPNMQPSNVIKGTGMYPRRR